LHNVVLIVNAHRSTLVCYMQVILLVEEHSKAELNIGYPGLLWGYVFFDVLSRA